MSLIPTFSRNHAHQRHGGRRADSEEDYCTYVTRLEKKTSMIDGPHFGNMQHAFKRIEVQEEVDKEFETAGRFGRAKHMGQPGYKGHRHNTSEEVETETVEFIERKQGYLIRS